MTTPIEDFATFKRLVRPGSRFSYYPPVTQWESGRIDNEILSKALSVCGKKTALYIHIPFCEQLCSFCGCNIKITNSTEGHLPYVDNILSEWEEIKKNNSEIEISHLHLGGGTPNFLSATNLQHLLYSLLSDVKRSADFYGTVEFDPRLIDEEKFRILKDFSFTKAVIGVQDFEEKVLTNVNRPQDLKQVSYSVDMLNKYDFDDVSLEFIYGLPFQTEESFNWTITRAVEFPITGIILYPLAVAPWQRGTQKAVGHFPEPELETYFSLYKTARNTLSERGFYNFGLGHFYRESSPLYTARAEGTLYRDVTGFKKIETHSLIGLGVSAISHLPGLHLQNQRVYEKYIHLSGKDKLSERFYQMTEVDSFLQDFFREIICTGKITSERLDQYEEIIERPVKPILDKLNSEGLIEIDQITARGMDLIKTICLSFD